VERGSERFVSWQRKIAVPGNINHFNIRYFIVKVEIHSTFRCSGNFCFSTSIVGLGVGPILLFLRREGRNGQIFCLKIAHPRNSPILTLFSAKISSLKVIDVLVGKEGLMDNIPTIATKYSKKGGHKV